MISKEQQLSLIKKNIKIIPNYPKPGILFRDITGLLENPCSYAYSISLLTDNYRNYELTKIVGIEARGFLFAAPIALALKLGLIPARKPGKLPRETISESYGMEYGTGIIEIHKDAVVPGDKILIVDDLLATGGTVNAVINLIRRMGGNVQYAAFVVNLINLGGKVILDNLGVISYSLILLS